MTSSAEPKPAAPALVWPSLDTAGLEAIGKARSEAVNLVQWLARIANSFVAGDTPQQRVTLTFRSGDAAFVTGVFDANLALEMRLPVLEMQFLQAGEPVPHVLDPEEHSPAEVEAWILVELLHHGVDRAKFTKALPYSVADLMSGDAEDHSPQSCRQALVLLETWYRNAATVLQTATGTTGCACWPQDLSLRCRRTPRHRHAASRQATQTTRNRSSSRMQRRRTDQALPPRNSRS